MGWQEKALEEKAHREKGSLRGHRLRTLTLENTQSLWRTPAHFGEHRTYAANLEPDRKSELGKGDQSYLSEASLQKLRDAVS